MLILGRTPDCEAGDRNCIVIDHPDGTRIRVWLLRRRGHGGQFVGVDAPGCRVLRGELLDPLETLPEPKRTA